MSDTFQPSGDVVALLASINLTPSQFHDKVSGLMSEYVVFVQSLMRCMGAGEALAIVDASPGCVQINDGVQRYLFLERKGLVHTNCDPSVYGGLTHPVVKSVSSKAVQLLASNPLLAFSNNEEPSSILMANIVAANVVGGVQYIMPFEWIMTHDISGFMDLSSTVH